MRDPEDRLRKLEASERADEAGCLIFFSSVLIAIVIVMAWAVIR